VLEVCRGNDVVPWQFARVRLPGCGNSIIPWHAESGVGLRSFPGDSLESLVCDCAIHRRYTPRQELRA